VTQVSTPDGRAVWPPLLALLLGAAALRALGYTGYFGSDEVTYTEYAFKLLHGDWRVDPYVGANRYGINIPVALSAALFGQNEFGAAFWSLFCSVAEVGLVAWFGMRWFGLRVGLLAGVLLATLPIHAHYAGRLLADAPLALAITASFLFFFEGERSGRKGAYLIAGLAAGWTFWVKQGTIFYLLVFLLYPLLFRRFDWRWGWMLLGFALAIGANLAWFAALTGDPLYIVRAIGARRGSGYLEEGVAGGSIVDAPAFYLDYLFVKVHQTFALGLLFLAGVVTGPRDDAARAPYRWVLWWGLGLVAALSVLPVSFSPLLFVPKQTNYMLMFVAPLCLVGAFALARLGARATLIVLVAITAVSLLLTLLQQASVRVFTANSRAAVDFARARPDAALYATANAARAATFTNLVEPGRTPVRIGSMEDLAAAPTDRDRLAILDTQTWAWASREPIRRVQDVPACWQREATLVPRADGAGVRLAATTASLLGAVPGLAAVAARFTALSAPSPAYVYRLPAGCAAPAVAKPR
jgi:4-amino-4-deoxy-L-arabinose transferase-like glycosyltransferase